jgi:cobalt-zinc-cadmium efflux system protein
MSAGHDHSHGMAKQTLRLAFFLTLIIVAAEVTGGLLAHSLALLSDAGHALTDIFALGLAWLATAQAERPANARKTFGYHRVGILAALTNALTLLLVTVWILYEAVQRFQHPETVQPLFMFASAGIGIAVNLYIGFGLQKEKENLNARAAALHVFGDVGASLGVIVAGLVILLTGWTPADLILSVGIAALIAVGAWRIVRETTNFLLEAVPQDIRMEALVRDMRSIAGVEDVHDLHVWGITSGMSALSCHALIADQQTSESASILRSLETMLSERYRIGHSTIQFECHAHQEQYCSVDGLYCQMEAPGHDHDHSHAFRSGRTAHEPERRTLKTLHEALTGEACRCGDGEDSCTC